jgi:hypothetical protein
MWPPYTIIVVFGAVRSVALSSSVSTPGYGGKLPPTGWYSSWKCSSSSTMLELVSASADVRLATAMIFCVPLTDGTSSAMKYET